MKRDNQHILKIRADFANMQTVEDLLILLNLSNELLFGDNADRFTLSQLTYFANPKVAKNRYKDFTIKKKSGGTRTIHAPRKVLKRIQTALSFVLQCVFEPHKAATGFVMEKSVVDNAHVHVGQNYVFNVDLKDFFPSIDQARVWKCLQLHPFYLNKDTNKPVNFISLDDFKKDVLKLEKEEKLRFRFKEYAGYAEVFLDKSKVNTKSILGTDIFGESGKEYLLKAIINKELFERHNNEKLELIVYTKPNVAYKSNSSEPKRTCVIGEVSNIKNDGRLRLANLLASLCCTEMEVERRNEKGDFEVSKKSVLPQGAPTSPVLTNVVCQRLDYLLTGVAKRFGLRYTRYADDITFSSMHNVYQADGEFINELKRIIKEQGFDIKESKTRLQKAGFRQEVTGLLVNEKVNVQKRYIHSIRNWIYLWERYGYEKAQAHFNSDYLTDKGHTKSQNVQLENVLQGKLAFLMMVKGKDNATVQRLVKRFEKLRSKQSMITKILDIWEKGGIEKAMEAYYANEIHSEKVDVKKIPSRGIQIVRCNLLDETSEIESDDLKEFSEEMDKNNGESDSSDVLYKFL